MSPNQGGPPTKLPLKVMHPNNPLLSSERIHLKAPLLSRHGEPTPTSKTIGVVFGTHTLLGPWGLVPFLTQTNLFAKLESFIRS